MVDAIATSGEVPLYPDPRTWAGFHVCPYRPVGPSGVAKHAGAAVREGSVIVPDWLDVLDQIVHRFAGCVVDELVQMCRGLTVVGVSAAGCAKTTTDQFADTDAA